MPLITGFLLVLEPLASPRALEAREAAAENAAVADRSPYGDRAEVERETEYWKLVDLVEGLLAEGRGLDAKLEIERAALSELMDPRSAETLAGRASARLSQVVAGTVETLAKQDLIALVRDARGTLELIDGVLSELLSHYRVAAMSGGDNRVFGETFAQTQTFRDPRGRKQDGYPVDCDGATVLIFAVLDEIEALLERSTEERTTISVLSYSEHLAMRVEDPLGETWIGDMNTAPNPETGRVRVRWWEESLYRQRMLERFGERGVVLRDWHEVLSNTWEVTAARLFEGHRYRASLFFAGRAIESNQLGPGARNSMALALGAMNRLDESVELLEQAAELKTRGSLILSNLASVYLKLGRNQDAFDASNRALRLEPTLSSAVLHRRFARSNLGDAEGASADWMLYLDLIGRSPGPLVVADP